ncbi:MAG TPA: CPBP family glutamic-type intramembrane protease, partial [Halanaerobiales bacterium]|nr:CPBP family glutamic-type intramembrane protease [Halanaerobiales bacterium]
QSLYLTSLFFGIAHFYGVPYGVVGVIMATFLGYIIGKSMLETRGFFWAFIIHMILDILIFSFMALNMITPGG